MAKGNIQLRGLATAAILKANFDQGNDHLGMFLPFVVDSVASLPHDDFSVQDLKECLRASHGLSIPQETLRILITRAKRKGFLRSEVGRYFRLPKVYEAKPLDLRRDSVTRDHTEIGSAFRSYAAAQSLNLETDEEALLLLISFLAENELAVLLHDDSTQIETSPGHRTNRIVARFFQKTLSENSRLTGILDQLIQGYVLQNALLLKDISHANRPFRNLEVFLDSKCVLRALGLEGDPNKIATREALAILKTTHARLAVFHSTIDEIRRILSLYEHRIGTAAGRESLYAVPLARHFLTNRYSPADVRQASALIEENLRQLGIALRQFPERKKEFTLAERALTLKLKGPNESETEPRIVHDVDCVAAILTLRNGIQPTSYDDAVAVFLTTNRWLVDTVTEWMTEERVDGLPVIVHQIRLTNFAWLKKPATGTKLKTNELMALCTAALRPSRKVWEQFLQHLKQLQAQDEVTSDEAVAILATSFLDEYLSNAEDVDDTDKDSLIGIIDRVKAKYLTEAESKVREVELQAEIKVRAVELQAESKVREVELQAESKVRKAQLQEGVAGEQARQSELWIKGIVDRIANVLALFVVSVVGVLILVGLVLCLPGFYDLWPGPRWIGWIPITVLAVLTVFNLFRGTALTTVFRAIQSWTSKKLESYVSERP